MSYLNVTNVSHSFGGRQILENVSFKLLRGEHVGLVGANGEGKSTFLNIVTGHVLPDEGKVEWPGKVTVGYLDQQSTLEKGMTIREVLRTAFDGMYAMEQQMLELYLRTGYLVWVCCGNVWSACSFPDDARYAAGLYCRRVRSSVLAACRSFILFSSRPVKSAGRSSSVTGRNTARTVSGDSAALSPAWL